MVLLQSRQRWMSKLAFMPVSEKSLNLKYMTLASDRENEAITRGHDIHTVTVQQCKDRIRE